MTQPLNKPWSDAQNCHTVLNADYSAHQKSGDRVKETVHFNGVWHFYLYQHSPKYDVTDCYIL